MASNTHVKQRVVMKFLVNKDVKPGEIYSRLVAQYDDETLDVYKRQVYLLSLALLIS